jgi:hypothetical protein
MPEFRSLRTFALALCLTAFLAVAGCGNSNVSKENYEKIQLGMTEDQVVAILGPGEVLPRSVTEVAKMMIWTDGDKVITIGFDNGKVNFRGQRGVLASKSEEE